MKAQLNTGNLKKPEDLVGDSKPKLDGRQSELVAKFWMLIPITLASFACRFWRLNHPNAVVFDELHYIKFISLYAKRIFFFDPQPPFGKQIFTLFASLVGFQGDLSYSQIGDLYKPTVPIYTLRLFPCVLGTLIAPLGYLISLEIGFSVLPATLVASALVFDNALILSSRIVLLDSILLSLIMSSVYTYLKFARNHHLIWLLISCTSVTLAVCTKYSAIYSYFLLVGLVTYSWWNSLAKSNSKTWSRRAIVYSACLFILPLSIYISIYYAHLSWLTKAGPHDSIMTSAFQASLENGLASIIKGQPLEIVHGSQLTLRHTHGRSCWLHSHDHLYPVKYSDGRGSSHQQQVTCYSFKDVNNWWLVKRPHIDELVAADLNDKIKDGDLIQLVHGLTGRTLNSHDVASAMNPYSQEVSCYVDHNISMPAQNIWRVHLLNPHETNNYWHTINSVTQLIHLNSSLALRFSGRQLPDWGFHQHEIVADRDLKHEDTMWNVEEHRYTKSEDQKEREYQLTQAEFVPLEPTSMTFLDKFIEVHQKLLSYQQEAVKDHLYASEAPIDWLFMSTGTAYWVDNFAATGTSQIFFMTNVNNNLNAIVCLLIFGCIIGCYILMGRRGLGLPIEDKKWQSAKFAAVLMTGGYLANYVPYFAYESPLFLHFYLTAYIFLTMFIGALVQHLYDLPISRWIADGALVVIVLRTVEGFWRLSPLTYGWPLSAKEVESLRLSPTWQLLTVNN